MRRAGGAEKAVMLASLCGLAAVLIGRHSIDTGKSTAPVEVHGAPRNSVRLGAELRFGRPDARTSIVEFFDYECPPCRFSKDAIEETAKKATDAAFYYQRYPIEFHKHAKSLALIALSLTPRERAGFEQAAWTYGDHDLDRLVAMWESRLAGVPEWRANAGKLLATTKRAADLIGVKGTPTLFVEDRMSGRLWRCAGLRSLRRAIALAQSGP